MRAAPFQTRYATFSFRQAALVLAVTAFALGWCLWATLRPKPDAAAPADGGVDLSLYRHIVDRVHAGESYYDAAGSELRAAGYPTGSMFNWRTPLYAWLIGALPSAEWGQGLICLIAIVTLLTAYTVLEREAGVGRAAVGVLLMLGAFEWCIDGDAFLSQELWAGVLITLSVCAYALGCWPAGIAAGLLALFFRELTLPYAVIALGLAWRERRRPEAILWIAGLALYALFLFYHRSEVLRRVTPDDRVPTTWFQFGGTPFILTTCRMNVFLFSTREWLSAIYLPLALLGLGAWRGSTGLRLGLTVAAYVSAFAIVGQPFNDYWGLLYVALLPFGLVWSLTALRELTQIIRGPLLGGPARADDGSTAAAAHCSPPAVQ